ncbi:MAG: cytoplasmic protein [Desulfobacterales bacterium]|nr:cytoplasmic protein [Desulfobacterales bacterium]
MADNGGTPNNLDFIVDKDNLYKEENFTDYKIATIRRLTPVKVDGSLDESRQQLFFGSTTLNTPQGPVPIQAKPEADTMEEAIERFPQAMEVETKNVVETFKRMAEQQAKAQKAQKANESRIIMPGIN